MRRSTIVLLVSLVLVLPAFLSGWQARFDRLAVSMSEEPTPDAVGFIALADTGVHPTYGWREPLFPLLVASVARAAGISSTEALNAVVVTASCVLLPLAFLFAYTFCGPVAAVIFTYLVAYSPLHVYMLWYRERTDPYLVLLFLIWICLLKRWTWALVVIAAVATYVRLTSGMTVLLTLGLLLLFDDEMRRTARQSLGRGIAAAALYLVLVAPLLGYYWVEYGSPLYPQTLVTYDYYVRYTTGTWVVDVTSAFDTHYEIPKDYSYFDLFHGSVDFLERMGVSARRLFMPTTRMQPSDVSLYFPHAVFAAFYVAGFLTLLVLPKRRFLLALFLGYSLPFMSLAFLPGLGARFFIPSLTLAYLIAATAMQDCVDLLRRDSGGAATGAAIAVARPAGYDDAAMRTSRSVRG